MAPNYGSRDSSPADEAEPDEGDGLLTGEAGEKAPKTVAPLRRVGVLNASLLLITAVLGVGVMELPGNAAVLGAGPSVPLFLVVGACCVGSGVALQRVAELYPESTATLGAAATTVGGGRAGAAAVLLQRLYIVSVLAAFFVLLRTSIQGVFYDAALGAAPATVAAMLILFPSAAAARSLHSVSSAASVVALSTVLGCLLIVLWQLFEEGGCAKSAPAPALMASEPLSVLTPASPAQRALTGIVYAYAGHSIFLEIIAEMTEPGQFWKALSLAYGLMALIYAGVSVVVVSVRRGATPHLLTNEVADGPAKRALNLLLAAHVVVVYIANQQVVARAFHVYWSPQRANDESSTAAKKEWAAISGALLLLCVLIASAIPRFEALTSLIGAVLSSAFCFFIPTWLLYAASKKAAAAVGLLATLWLQLGGLLGLRDSLGDGKEVLPCLH